MIHNCDKNDIFPYTDGHFNHKVTLNKHLISQKKKKTKMIKVVLKHVPGFVVHCHKCQKLVSFSHNFYPWSWDSMLLNPPLLASGARFSRKMGNITMFAIPLNLQNSIIFIFLPYYQRDTCQSKQNTTTAPPMVRTLQEIKEMANMNGGQSYGCVLLPLEHIILDEPFIVTDSLLDNRDLKIPWMRPKRTAARSKFTSS